MKIGIFGDSFSQHCMHLQFPQVSLEEQAKRRAWWDYLSEIDGIELTNHSVSGSSLYYSYHEFLKYHQNYDYIIVLVTSWGRTWLPQLKTIFPWVPGIRQAEVNLKICRDEDDRKILESLIDYYVYVEHKDYSIDMHKIMCKDMRNLHTNTLLIPCFPNNGGSFIPDWEGPCLEDISRIDSSFYKVDQHTTPCRRHGHINDANNYILFQKIYDWVKSDGNKKFTINLSDYKEPIEPFEYNYFHERPPMIDYLTCKPIV